LSSHVHLHVWLAIFLGGAITIFPVWTTRAWPGSVLSRYTIAVGQTLMSTLLIHLTGGRVETHFHIFGSLVILSFYRDWRVLIPATALVGIDHFVRGIYYPYSAYGVLSASPWRSLEHAGWVVFEDIFLVISCLRSVREMRAIAKRTAEVEAGEERFRNIFEEAPLGMATVGVDGHFLQVNTRLAQMAGYSGEEMAQLRTAGIVHADDVAAEKGDKKSLLAGETPRCVTEERYVRRDGSLLWVLRTMCLVRDEGREPLYFLAMIEDISERRRAAAALQESEERFRQFAEHIDEVFWMSDPHKESLIYISPAYAQLWGRSCEDLYRAPHAWLEAVHPEDRDRVRLAALTKQVGGEYEEEYRVLRPDGSMRWVRDRAFPIEDGHGKVYRIAGVAVDITEQKRSREALEQAKEESERANLAKSEFLSRMSHELRTPLNAILGFGQLLEMEPLTTKQAQGVQHILKGGRHLLSLINEVLDIARIEAGRLEFSLEAVPVQLIIEDAATMIAPLARQRGIRVLVPEFAETSSSWHVHADLQRTKQVVLNLLANAIKYNHDGGEVIVTCGLVDDELDSASRVRIAVRDTGPGMSAHQLRKLFTPFERLGAERGEVEGSGIGLALSKRLSEAMGGRIEVASTVGEGSTFAIELVSAPACESRFQVTPRPPEVAPEPERAPVAQRTILQIEDNMANQHVILRLLDRRPEVRLLSAMQGQIGLELAREHRPDLVLLDLHLPDIPGIEVLARLRAHPLTREIPVVVLSADATQNQIDRLLGMGALDYLTKPFELSKLLAILDRVLEEAATGRDSASPARSRTSRAAELALAAADERD
jgi:PAS domain S-box-containing protein